MDKEKKIKILAEHLIWAINQAYLDSDLIQEALTQIEEEGYQVDILLAAFTRFDKSDTQDPDAPAAEQTCCLFAQATEPADENELEEEEEEDPSDEIDLSSELNEFDRTFLKLIKVGYCEED